MKNVSTAPVLVAVFLIASGSSCADDVVLSIGPDFSVSSDTVTLCRVFARNNSGHALDGRAIAFEAQAWENGVLVMRERGRFGGKIDAGAIAESRIGFTGVFREFTIVPDEAKAGQRGGKSGRSAKGGAKTSKKSSSTASSRRSRPKKRKS